MAEDRIKDARNRSSRYGFMGGGRREAEMKLKINKKLAKGEEPKWKKKAGSALMKASKFLTKK